MENRYQARDPKQEFRQKIFHATSITIMRLYGSKLNFEAIARAIPCFVSFLELDMLTIVEEIYESKYNQSNHR